MFTLNNVSLKRKSHFRLGPVRDKIVLRVMASANRRLRFC